MASKEYTYIINTTDQTPTLNDFQWTDTTTTTWPWYAYSFYTYPYSATVYMYQVFCPKPRCKGVMWGELNHTVVCPKCFSTIKLVREPKPDYEVEVT